MRFETVSTEKGTDYFIDGYPVPQDVFDTFRPSRMFPRDTGLTLEQAEAKLAEIKAEIDALPKQERDFPYFALAIDSAHPLKSDALAIHIKQREQAMARNKRHGINVDYDGCGRPIFTDPNQRRKLMKLEGVRDRNSAYGY